MAVARMGQGENRIADACIRTFRRMLPLAYRKRLSMLRARLRRGVAWRIAGYAHYSVQRIRFRAVASPFKILYIDPRQVRAQLRNEDQYRTKWFWGTIKDGDWDRAINYRYGEDDFAYRSMCQHFHDGVPWEDTPLFAYYAKLLTCQPSTKGCRSLSELGRYYRSEIDSLHEDVRKNGIRWPSDPELEPIYVYIGRHGELIYSAGGNHRLHISKVLGIREFPVLVRMRHLHWQMVREAAKSGTLSQDSLVEYRGHPDLQDLL